MKFLFAGDFYPNTEKAKTIIRDCRYELIMRDVAPVIKEADFSIVNFESPIASPEVDKPFIAEGPKNLCSEKNAIECIKKSGFSMMALANNHLHDYGDTGVLQTLKACDDLEMNYCGAGKNLQEAQMPTITEVKGKTIGIVNFCENEFSVATPISAGANPFDLIDVIHQIKEARAKTDYVIVFIHGGIEHYQLPTPWMQKIYRYLIECGADIVVNSHQHCYSGFEIYKDRPIIYGLGNFFFDNGSSSVSKWNEGYMALIEEKEGKYNMITIPYRQGLKDSTITLVHDKESFNDKIAELNDTINNPERIKKEFDQYVQEQQRLLLAYFEPYQSRIALKLYRMGLLPSLLSNKKKVLILNRMRCESHRMVYTKAFSQSLGFPF